MLLPMSWMACSTCDIAGPAGNAFMVAVAMRSRRSAHSMCPAKVSTIPAMVRILRVAVVMVSMISWARSIPALAASPSNSKPNILVISPESCCWSCSRVLARERILVAAANISCAVVMPLGCAALDCAVLGCAVFRAMISFLSMPTACG